MASEVPRYSWPEWHGESTEKSYEGFPRNIAYIENLKLDPNLTPVKRKIAGTHLDSKILFLDVNIIDSTGRDPYKGDVLIEGMVANNCMSDYEAMVALKDQIGERIAAVGEVSNKEELRNNPNVRVFHGKGRTLMSGLGDAHAHFTWNGGDLNALGALGLEEHVILTAKSAQCFLDSGYTMCFGAAAAKDRLDAVIRDAINAGDLPGPRYLANAREIAKPDGELIPDITAYADGPEEMLKVIRHNVEKIGVDNIKLSMSGEEITETRSAQDCYFTDEETKACVDEAHSLKKRVCAHARARDSVIMCAKHDVDVIYHASYTDDEGK
ncbi:hypothetical protein F5Y19DRAFT_486943 [Xylariaceae sp. FL1651]|nr:hypothetical protein F5Y19DRAFT_486943 [Xylariaceae sp. FL1651]